MKAKLTFLLVPALAGALQLAPSLCAQQPSDRPIRPFRDLHSEWASLSEEDRAKLRAAHERAKADPAVQAARDRLRQAKREFREVMRPALLRADPSIQPILDKLRAERHGRD